MRQSGLNPFAIPVGGVYRAKTELLAWRSSPPSELASRVRGKSLGSAVSELLEA